MEKKIKVLIVDDMEAIRRRLERIISKQPDMELVPSASTGHDAVEHATIYKPDVILMDIEMENKYAGIMAAKEISENLMNTKIIILTVHMDDNIIFSAFQTGIIDYLVKDAPIDEIIDAIKSAFNNLSPIRPLIAEKIRNEFRRVKNSEESLYQNISLVSKLTASEVEVLKLFCENKSKKEIAKIRCVEEDTIKKQVNHILKKFNKRSMKEVVKTINHLKIFDVLNR